MHFKLNSSQAQDVFLCVTSGGIICRLSSSLDVSYFAVLYTQFLLDSWLSKLEQRFLQNSSIF